MIYTNINTAEALEGIGLHLKSQYYWYTVLETKEMTEWF